MSVSIAPAEPKDFEAALPLLRSLYANRSEQMWKRLFDYRWQRSQTHVGYLMRDGQKSVGYIGCLFSARTLDDKSHDFCNFTSWYVEPEYRKESLRLMMPILALKPLTITNFTPTPQAYKIFRGLRFQVLDTHRYLVPGLGGLFGSGRGRDRILFEDADVVPRLTPEQQRLRADHRLYGCPAVIVESSAGTCFVIFSRTRIKGSIPAAKLLHVSDTRIFWKAFATFQKHLLRRHGLAFLFVDGRLVEEPGLLGTMAIKMSGPKLFKSTDVGPKQIDGLYTELPVLGI